MTTSEDGLFVALFQRLGCAEGLFDSRCDPSQNAAMQVSLPTTLEEFVRRKVAEGEFPSPEAVVCQGLRMLQQSEQWKLGARSKIDSGWDQAKAGHLHTPEQVHENLAARKATWNLVHGGK